MNYAQYRVVGECAHATIDGVNGRIRTLVLKGAYIPADAPEVPHLLSVGLIRGVGEPVGEPAAAPDSTGDPTASVPGEGSETPNPAGPAATEGPEGATSPDPDVEEKRAAARAKLPTDGSAPDGRAAQAVWVEYLVNKGYDYDALKGEEKDALRELANGLS